MYPVTHMLGSRRNGVNHVSMNLAAFDAGSGPVRGTHYPVYSDALLDWYKTKNVQAVRLMFCWEAVQPTPRGAVPPGAGAGAGYANYWADLAGVLTRLLARGIYVTLCPWGYNPASGDTDIVYRGAAITTGDFADFWAKFAVAVNGVTGNDARVALDLINEPHTHAQAGNKPGDIGISLAGWFACAQAAITAIRAAGATNTIFVPGMAYADAEGFTTNGSSAAWLALTDPQRNIAVTAHCYTGLGKTSATILRDSCAALVAWARSRAIKVHIGEIAINAGSNGRTTFCGTFAAAQAQWADWTGFCAANDDVLVGWNWWGNSAAGWWNQGDSCDPQGYHWGLTLTDGASQTVYMDLIGSSLPVAALFMRDNAGDTGAEPNATTTIGWESPDIWVRKQADGGTVGEPITGGQPSVVYVRVTNRGLAASDDNAVVRLYWAKAEAGLSWPAPWDGSDPARGGSVGVQPVGAIAPGASAQIPFAWPDTPDPQDFGGDGHFCLLAFVTTAAAPPFVGLEGPDLNANVLRAGAVAWRNLHISAGNARRRVGDVVIANRSHRPMLAQVAFEILDDSGRAAGVDEGMLLLTASGRPLERLSGWARSEGPPLEDCGQGEFCVLDAASGLPAFELGPGEAVTLGVQYVPKEDTAGYAVRAIQYALDEGSRRTIGGQTFVVGQVDGLTSAEGGECIAAS